MESITLIFYLAISLAILNVILLIYAFIKKRVKILQLLFIILTGIVIPYLVANIMSSTAQSWEGFGRGIIGFIYTLFLLMIITLIYLVVKLKSNTDDSRIEK